MDYTELLKEAWLWSTGGEIAAILKQRKKLGKATPKLCPRCGSSEIRLSSNFDVYPKMFGIMPSQYVCEDCSYKGPTAMELEE